MRHLILFALLAAGCAAGAGGPGPEAPEGPRRPPEVLRPGRATGVLDTCDPRDDEGRFFDEYLVTLELSDVPRPSRVLFLAVKGWVVKAAELSGSELTDFVDGFSEDPEQPTTWTFEYM